MSPLDSEQFMLYNWLKSAMFLALSGNKCWLSLVRVRRESPPVLSQIQF